MTLSQAAPIEDLASREKCGLSEDLARGFLLVLLAFAASLPLLMKLPAPFIDEPGFIDPVVTLLRHGYLGTDLYNGYALGMEKHVYWQPPLYFLALAAWFRVFGIGLAQARAFSLICSVGTVLLVYALSRRWATANQAFCASALCVVSVWFQFDASVARMDSLCIFLTFASVLAYLRAIDRSGKRWYGVSGLLAGLAVLTHPLGVVALVVVVTHFLFVRRDVLRRSGEFGAFVACFAICVVAWTVYILQGPEAFWIQMHAQFLRKEHPEMPWWWQLWLLRKHPATILLALGACLWLIFGGWRRTNCAILAIAVMAAFVCALGGREQTYPFYYFSWACVAIAVLLKHYQGRRIVLIGCLALAISNELAGLGYNVWRCRHRDYSALSRTLRAAIPAGKSVYIGLADVSPYFALRDRNPMRAEIPVPLSKPNAHGVVASQCDYIVDSRPEFERPDIVALISSAKPIARVDQGDGYRIVVFDRRASASRMSDAGQER
ncbi:MAG: glycosyltransferase family 39 protein [Capsulimonadaceae bacterium]|nr:glycosyltransferase family 39 protein [Capsulimonadaceae bacterium]